MCNHNLHAYVTFVCTNTCRPTHTEYTLLIYCHSWVSNFSCVWLSVVRIFSILFHLHISWRNTRNCDNLFSVALVTAFMKNLLVVFCYILSCFDHNPRQCSALEHPSNMSSGPENVTTSKIMIYPFMNRINGCVCEHEKPNSSILRGFTLTLLITLGIFIIAFGRKKVKVNASATYPILREISNTEEVWGCYVGDHRIQRK